jgi:hypothetical protein
MASFFDRTPPRLPDVPVAEAIERCLGSLPDDGLGDFGSRRQSPTPAPFKSSYVRCICDRYLFAVYLAEGEAELIASVAASRDAPRTAVLREAVRSHLSAKSAGS